MTDQNNAAQPVLTDEEILQVFADAVGNQEDDARFIDVDRDQAIRIARTLLSKLRAPVADERAAFEASYRSRFNVPAHAGLTFPDVAEAWKWWQRRAALASAPAPKPWPVEEQPDGTVTPVDPADMGSAPVAEPETMEESQPIAPDDEAISECWISASDSDGIAYDGPSFERGYRLGEIAERDRQASAPIAGEAVGHVYSMMPLVPGGRRVQYASFNRDLSDGTPLYAAPQAMPDDARRQVIAECRRVIGSTDGRKEPAAHALAHWVSSKLRAAPRASATITHYECGPYNGDGTYEAVPVYAAPLASAGDARRALGGYQTDSFRVLKTHPAHAAAKDGQQRAGDVSPLLARALDEWHEDDGPVMWWAWCGHEWAGEVPWCGTPHYQDWPGYHTHWTPIAGFPAAPSPQSAAIRNSLIADPSGGLPTQHTDGGAVYE
jgi:hypothetical protein